MNDFLRLPGVERSTLAKVVAAVLIVSGVFSLCCGAGSVLLGGVLGLGAIFGGSAEGLTGFAENLVDAAATQGTITEQEAAEARAEFEASQEDLRLAEEEIAGLGAVSFLAIAFGVLSLVTGPFSIIVGAGLLGRQSWARMGTVIVAALTALTGLFGLFASFGIGNLLWVLLGAFIAYFFYTDPEMKAYLESKPAV